ncbi:hypothetical protein [Paenibacillus harenae]|uniref:hypothetical protein n=1 Tax=Paenibacillus harenae TaxID=306543 RepID=UPI0012EB57B8|nr:hypothetical protein [Paenibacillus harenae]
MELGPAAGKQGGHLIFQGNLEDYLRSESSGISPYLSGKKLLPYKKPEQRRTVSEQTPTLTIRNANLHNLKDVTATIPLGVMVGIAGVSGSGKSTLISDTLVPLLKHYLNTEQDEELEEEDELLYKPSSAPHELGTLEGWQSIEKCVVVTQEPIGRFKMSMPITYVGIWDKIRMNAAKPAKPGPKTDYVQKEIFYTWNQMNILTMEWAIDPETETNK